MTNDFVSAIQDMINGSIPKKTLFAIVKTPPPNITIEYLGVTIPSEQIEVLNYLMPKYHRKFTMTGTIKKLSQNYSASDMSLAGEGPHKHNLISSESTGTFEFEGDIFLEDTLRVGSKVLVEIIDNTYVIVGQSVKQTKEGA